ncbi:MAG TPA: M20/M25/M40 family metallo-hydrolase [Longimicrobiales bacterium]|nr:M20/M25/M40 family metallo-hydrolase [Longimicrobiales bacterium]
MRVTRPIAVVLIIAVSACAGVQSPAAAPVPSADAVRHAASAIVAADVLRHVEYLASDELRGRDTPSPGLERAAAYLSARLGEFGLQPAGDDGTFIRRDPVAEERVDEQALRIEARIAGRTFRPLFGSDLFVLPARVDSVVGIPLYVGRAGQGVHVPPAVAGRIAAFFVPDSLGAAWQSAVTSALQGALMARASAALLIMDSVFAPASVAMLADQLGAEVAPLPVIGVSWAFGATLFEEAGLDLLAASAHAAGAPVPLDAVTMALRTPLTSLSERVPNVVAVLPGSDPVLRDEYVVYTAHFDHVGVGRPDASGDSIYNGADDNASGTAALLKVARAFASLERAPSRSLMFVFVSGEEKGLLGSRAFVENPPVTVDAMVANINMDMVGRNAPDTIVAIGQEYSSLGATLDVVAARNPALGLVVAADPWPEEQLFYRSDHFSFAAREVPSIFLTAGLHEQYHQPGDEAHLIDTDKVARVARLVFFLGHELATVRDRPAWTAAGLDEVRRATSGGF